MLLALAPSPTLAQPRHYQIDMKYSVNGRLESSPRVVVNEGKEAEIGDTDASGKNGRFIKVKAERVASKAGNQVRLHVRIETLENGKRKLVASPELVVLENENASMEIAEKGGGKVAFSALVTRTN